MTSTLPQQLPLISFALFEVERCIRVKYHDGHVLHPVDARQDDHQLRYVEPYDELLLDCPSLVLIETEKDGEIRVMMEHPETDLAVAALYSDSEESTLSIGDYAGVRWRVLGHDAHGQLSVTLAEGNCEDGIRQIAESLQAMVSAQ